MSKDVHEKISDIRDFLERQAPSNRTFVLRHKTGAVTADGVSFEHPIGGADPGPLVTRSRPDPIQQLSVWDTLSALKLQARRDNLTIEWLDTFAMHKALTEIIDALENMDPATESIIARIVHVTLFPDEYDS